MQPELKFAACFFCLPAIPELVSACKLNFLLLGQAGAGLQKLASHAISGAAMLSIMLGSVSPALAEPLFPSLTEKTQPTEVQKSPLQEMKVCLGPLTLMTCGLYALDGSEGQVTCAVPVLHSTGMWHKYGSPRTPLLAE